MSCPNIKNFSAWINSMPGSINELIVQGEVETSSGSITPMLTEAEPQGINQKILILNLHLKKSSNPGIQVISYQGVRFVKKAEIGQYESVEINSEGEVCTSLSIGEVV